MRPRTILAVARRDLRQEFSGQRGLGLVIVTALLLGAVTLAPRRERNFKPEVAPAITVAGHVPPAVLALDDVHFVERQGAHLVFLRERDGSGPLKVVGAQVPANIRKALDGDAPAVRLVKVEVPWNWPGRSLLLALIATSALTGAISESIGGERSRNTLDALLTAAVTRWEIVVGKWLAWTAYGAGTGWAAAAVTVLLGRQDPGLWLIALPFVPACTVALGLAMNRQVRDVLTGATVSMRWLPIAVSATALLSWQLGHTDPRLGGLVPLGGALMATGGTWEGVGGLLTACLSSTVAMVALLALTARDLGTDPPTGIDRWGADALTVTALAALAWWVPLLTALLWAPAGNPAITDAVSPGVTLAAGAAGLLLLAAVRQARRRLAPALLGHPLVALAALPAAGLLHLSRAPLWIAHSPSTPLPLIDSTLAAAATGRGSALPLAALSVVAQELLFRGWLQQRAGPIVAAVAWTAVVYPTQPLLGIATAAVLGLLARGGGLSAALLAHLGLLAASALR